MSWWSNEMSAWKSVEAAPKDGSLLLFTNQGRVALGRWTVTASRDTLNDVDGLAQFCREYGWRFAGDKTLKIEAFTHFMAVPPPPASGANK
jgi:hypothetical protein